MALFSSGWADHSLVLVRAGHHGIFLHDYIMKRNMVGETATSCAVRGMTDSRFNY